MMCGNFCKRGELNYGPQLSYYIHEPLSLLTLDTIEFFINIYVGPHTGKSPMLELGPFFTPCCNWDTCILVLALCHYGAPSAGTGHKTEVELHTLLEMVAQCQHWTRTLKTHMRLDDQKCIGHHFYITKIRNGQMANF